jgi:hypothetical protein
MFQGHYNLRDDFGVPYNPEWVSVDIAGYNVMLTPIEGSNFIHRCVPEPGTFVLLATGLLAAGFFGWRWKRR